MKFNIFGGQNPLEPQTCFSKSNFRPPSGMAVSRSYPSHFFRFCEKEKAFHLLFSSIASFSIQKDATFLLV